MTNKSKYPPTSFSSSYSCKEFTFYKTFLAPRMRRLMMTTFFPFFRITKIQKFQGKRYVGINKGLRSQRRIYYVKAMLCIWPQSKLVFLKSLQNCIDWNSQSLAIILKMKYIIYNIDTKFKVGKKLVYVMFFLLKGNL